MIRDLSYLVISDIHFGHKRTPTEDIIKHFNTFFDNFTNKSQFTDVDLIIIAGDMFDRLLDFNSTDIHDITVWLYRLMNFCKRHDIRLRVLEGTPSHDWKQSRIVSTIAKMSFSDIDIKYIDTLLIETIEDLDLTILYVPDEWSAKTCMTFDQVQTLLKEQNLTEVDIAIMHGCFKYQVGVLHDRIDTHKESDYLNIVRYFINIGHFHTYTNYKRIIAQGSFDRLSHGEEETKGATLVHIGSNPRHYFIPNREAKIFKTINIRFKDTDKALKSLAKQLSTIPEGSYVRIKATKDNHIYVSLDTIRLKYPMYVFSKVLEDSDTVIETQLAILEYTPISITPDNILKLILDNIADKYDLRDTEMDILNTNLKEVHNVL